MPPPEGSWQRIASTLEQDFSIQEQRIAQKLDDACLEPPKQIQQYIFDALDKKLSKPASLISFPQRKWVAAAAVLLIIAGAWWWFNGPTDQNLTATLSETVIPKNSTGTEKNPSPITGSNTPANKIALHVPRKLLNNVLSTLEETDNPTPQTDTPATEIDAIPVNDELIRTADATPEAGVDAPLIRDGRGKLIMDLSLLTTAGGKYINVTGPNGEQTKISSKFASYLMYLRGSSSKSEEYLEMIFRSGNSWKKRFEKWRLIMMQSPDFIPSSMNFMDILELKDLLKENQ